MNLTCIRGLHLLLALGLVLALLLQAMLLPSPAMGTTHSGIGGIGGAYQGADGPDDDDDQDGDEADDEIDFDRSEIVDEDGDPSTDGFRADQAIVRLARGARIQAFNERHDTSTIAAIPGRDIYLLQLSGEAEETAEVQLLSADPDVVWAELNFVEQAPEGRPGRFFVSGTPTSADPATSYAPSLLGLDNAWSCMRGGGVIVAVLDTGVDPAHPLLAGRLRGAGWNVLDASADVGDEGNGVDDDGDGLVDEMTGHGTHVAGIVAQAAPAASILPIKALDSDGVGDAFFLALGIYYALDNGADVINLSLGSTYNSRVVAEATQEAVDARSVVVAAGGNADRQQPAEFPATGGAALGVASTNAQDVKSAFSNYHPVLTISAPGSEIISAFPGGGYASWSGTSMATPWVSGAAALLISADSNLGPSGVARRLSRAAAPLDETNPSYAGLLGAGRLDVGRAAGCTANRATATGTRASRAPATTKQTQVAQRERDRPILVAKPARGRPGSQATVTVRHLPPGERVTLRWYNGAKATGRGRRVAQGVVQPDGTVTLQFKIPGKATSGRHRLRVQVVGAPVRDDALFTVLKPRKPKP